MKVQLETDDDFRIYKEEIKRRLRSRGIRTVDKPDYMPAAVMIILMNKQKEPHVLLTKRTHDVRTHKGEMSMPGGGFDETDGDILGTALRETFEEVGIKPDDIDIIGRFDEFISIYKFHVSTFVGTVDYPYRYIINRSEIEDYVEAPLSIFVNKEYDKVDTIEYEGSKHNIYYYNYNGFTIWGLTARILTDFGSKVIKGYLLSRLPVLSNLHVIFSAEQAVTKKVISHV